MCGRHHDPLKAVEKEFISIIQEHDKGYNPSGVPFKSKRPAEANPEDLEKENLAVAIPRLADGPTTKDALKEKTSFQVLQGKQAFMEHVVTEKGDYYIWGIDDGILPKDEPLFQLRGRFKLRQAATAVMSSGPDAESTIGFI